MSRLNVEVDGEVWVGIWKGDLQWKLPARAQLSAQLIEEDTAAAHT